MGGAAGRLKREGVFMHYELIHVVVRQKLQWDDGTGGVPAVVLGARCREPCVP